MALLSKTVNFLALTSLGTQAITGVGFQPKLVIIYRAPDASNNLQFHMGAASGSASNKQWHVCSFSDNGQSTSDCSRWVNDGSIIGFVRDNQAEEVEANLQSFDSDGFTLDYTIVAGGFGFTAICLGGDFEVDVGTLFVPNTTGQFSKTGLSFQPKAISVATIFNSLSSTAISQGFLGLGYATDSSQSCIFFRSVDNQTTSDTYRTASESAIIKGSADGSTFFIEIDHVSMNSDGFTLDNVDPPGSSQALPYIAFGGNIEASLNTITQQSNGVQNVTGLGFEPSYTFMMGDQSNAVDVVSSSAAYSFGFADGTNQRVGSARDVNGQSTTNALARSVDGIALSNDTSGNSLGQATYTNTSDGYDLTWTNSDGANRNFFGLSIGDAASGITVTLDSGSYSYTGTDVILIDPPANETIVINAGSYTISGTNINLVADYREDISSGSYAYTGTDIILIDPIVPDSIIIDTGSYELTGTLIQTAIKTQVDSGSYALTGTAINFAITRGMTIEQGSYIIQGTNIDFSNTGNIWTDKPSVDTLWGDKTSVITNWTDK